MRVQIGRKALPGSYPEGGKEDDMIKIILRLLAPLLCPLIGHDWAECYKYTYQCTRCGALSTGERLGPDQPQR